MADSTLAESAPSSNLKRYLFIGVPIVLIVVIGIAMFWPRIDLTFRINALNSDNPTTRRTVRKDLVESPREDWIDDAIAAALSDSDRTFSVRHTLVDILIERERLNHVERAYLEGDLGTRSVILAALQGRPYFVDTYVADSRFDVDGTVRAWLERDGDFTRSHAIQIAMQLDMADTIGTIRPLLDLSSGSVPVASKKRRDLLIAALGAVQRFGDCESAERVLALARTGDSGLLRWRAAQTLDRLVSGDDPTCPDAVSDEEMAALIVSLLDDEDPTPRIGALTNLELHPDRARGASKRVLEILDGGANQDGPERRHALHVLLTMAEPAFLDRLPIYFFDTNANVRSSLAQKAIAIETPRLDSCLIGLVQHEVEREIVFRNACESLRRRAGSYKGVPKSMIVKSRDDRNAFWSDLDTIFGGASVDGATREDLVKGWFDWLAEDLGLDQGSAETAWATKLAFWKAADRGDADAARAALEAFGPSVSGLFTYELAWLDLNE